MALSQSFNPTAVIRRSLIATAAAVTLMGGTAYAQEAAPAEPTPVTDTATRGDSNANRNGNGSTTVLNDQTCMETTQTSSRNGGFLGIIGVVKRNSTTSVYNEACGTNRITEAAAISMMTATTPDGTPDIPMRALGIQIYLEQSPENRARLDRALAAQNTTFGQVNFSIAGSTGAMQCVRQPAATPVAAGQVTTNVSFRCLPRATTTAPAAETPTATVGTVGADTPAVVTGTTTAALTPPRP